MILSILIPVIIVILLLKKYYAVDINKFNVNVKTNIIKKIGIQEKKKILKKTDNKNNVVRPVNNMNKMLSAMTSDSNQIETIIKYGNYVQISRKAFFCTNQNDVIKLSERMLELASNKVQKLQALLNIANAFENMNDYKKALEILLNIPDDFTTARLEGKTIEKFYDISSVYNKMNNHRKALEYIEKALKNKAQLKSTRHYQISLYDKAAKYAAKTGDKEKTKYYLEKVISESPNDRFSKMNVKNAKTYLNSIDEFIKKSQE